MVIVLLTLVAIWYLWKRRTDGLAAYDLVATWALKMAAACLFLFVYTAYYGSGTLTADPQAFMLQSKMLHDVANESVADYFRFLVGLDTPELISHYLANTSHWTVGDLTLINDSKNVIRVNSLVWFISGGNVYVHTLVFSFCSLLGFRELYLTFSKQVSISKRVFWYALVLCPSVLFWTGSMLKEPLMMVGLCLVIRAVFSELTLLQKSWRWILGVLLMLAFKPYVLLCLLIALSVYYTAKLFFRGKAHWSLLSLTGMVVIALLLFPKQREKGVFYLTRKQFDFINIGKGGLHAYADTCFFFFRPDQFQYLEINEADSSIFLTRPLSAKLVALGKAHPFKDVYLQPNYQRWILYFRSNGCTSNVPVTFINASFSRLVRNIPQAFANATFRPFFGDPGGWLKYFAVIETMLLFGWVTYAFRSWKKASRETRLIVVTLWIFAIALLLLIGWITPVLGAIVRYRIPAYLAILLASLLLFKQSPQSRTKASN
jgi:hypothetical protein